MIFRAISKAKILFARIRKKLLAKRFSVLVCQVDSGKRKISDNDRKQELKFEKETVKKYDELIKKRVDSNPLILVEVLSIKSIIFEFYNYHDKFPCLLLRRYMILAARFFNLPPYHLNFFKLD